MTLKEIGARLWGMRLGLRGWGFGGGFYGQVPLRLGGKEASRVASPRAFGTKVLALILITNGTLRFSRYLNHSFPINSRSARMPAIRSCPK